MVTLIVQSAVVSEGAAWVEQLGVPTAIPGAAFSSAAVMLVVPAGSCRLIVCVKLLPAAVEYSPPASTLRMRPAPSDRYRFPWLSTAIASPTLLTCVH